MPEILQTLFFPDTVYVCNNNNNVHIHWGPKTKGGMSINNVCDKAGVESEN